MNYVIGVLSSFLICVIEIALIIMLIPSIFYIPINEITKILILIIAELLVPPACTVAILYKVCRL